MAFRRRTLATRLEAFGNVTWVKEEVRFMWGWTLWERLSGTALCRPNSAQNPAFAATAI